MMFPVMIAVMSLLMLIGIPVGVAIGMASLVGIGFFTQLPLLVFPQQAFVALDKFPLAAIPFFILAGNLMLVGSLSQRLVDFVEACIHTIRGGILLTCIITALVFGAVSGSSVATTLAIGSVLIPAMVRRGYPVGFAAALQATAAEMSVLIPPSIPMILYGLAANISVRDLFMAGIGAGLMVAAVLGGFVLIWTRWQKIVEIKVSVRPRFWPAFKDALPALAMPCIVLGGIYGGVFTPTEASIVAVFYALLVSLIYQEITFMDLITVLKKTVIASAIIMFIISMAGVFFFHPDARGGAGCTWWLDYRNLHIAGKFFNCC